MIVSNKTTLSLTRADVVTLRTAVSYLSESEGNGPDLDALLDKLYRRLDQAVARLDSAEER
jgi:hypothetical protein